MTECRGQASVKRAQQDSTIVFCDALNRKAAVEVAPGRGELRMRCHHCREHLQLAAAGAGALHGYVAKAEHLFQGLYKTCKRCRNGALLCCGECTEASRCPATMTHCWPNPSGYKGSCEARARA